MKTTEIAGLAVKDGTPRAAILGMLFWFFLLAVAEVCHAESGNELTPPEALEWSRQRLREDRDDEAREMLERHFRLASESLGPDAPATLEIMSLLVTIRWLQSDEVVATAMSKDLIGRLRRSKGEFSPEAVRALRMVAMYLTNRDDKKAYLEGEFAGYLEWFEANARSAQDPESLFVPLDALTDAELPNLYTRLLATATLIAMNQSGPQSPVVRAGMVRIQELCTRREKVDVDCMRYRLMAFGGAGDEVLLAGFEQFGSLEGRNPIYVAHDLERLFSLIANVERFGLTGGPEVPEYTDADAEVLDDLAAIWREQLMPVPEEGDFPPDTGVYADNLRRWLVERYAMLQRYQRYYLQYAPNREGVGAAAFAIKLYSLGIVMRGYGLEVPPAPEAKTQVATGPEMVAFAAGIREDGKPESARVLLEMYLGQRPDKAVNDQESGQATSALASIYEDLGRPEDAVPLRSRLVDFQRNALGNQHRETLRAIQALASVLSSAGKPADALPFALEAYATARETHDGTHLTLLMMEELAYTYVRIGRFDQAVPLFEERVRFFARYYGEEEQDTLFGQADLAIMLARAGRRKEAQPLMKQAYQKVIRLYLSDRDARDRLVCPLVEVMDMSQEVELGAVRACERVTIEKYGQTHPETLRAITRRIALERRLGVANDATDATEREIIASFSGGQESRFDPRKMAFPEALEAVAAYALNLARSDDAGKRKDGLEELQAFVAVVEHLRASPLLRREDRMAFFQQHVAVYHALSGLLAEAGNVPEAFRLSELSKARTLLESTALQRATSAGGLPTEEQERLGVLERDVRRVEDRLAKLALRDPEQRAPGDDLRLAALSLSMQKRLEDLRRELRQRYPKYGQLSEVKTLDAQAGATALPEDALLLTFLPMANDWQLFALDRSGVLTVHRLSGDAIANLAARVQRYRDGLLSAQANGHAWRGMERRSTQGMQDVERLAEELGAALLGPLRERLATHRQLIISPDGVLATLPFESLLLDGKPLIASHDVGYAQSLSVYALLRERDAEYAQVKRRKPLLAMGNPVYAQGAASTRSADSVTTDALDAMVMRGGASGVTQAYESLQLRWPELPGTARELDAVGRIFGVRSLQREQASEQALRRLDGRGELAKYRYLLFSAHGYLSVEAPALSALVLSQSPALTDAANDGYVSASEWPAYNLKSDLLVLSACETALGKQAQGEGIMGLPYALYVAGNKNTVLTLWQIDDAASAEFIERFFRKLKQGQDQVRALNETKREFLQDERLSNPRYWAPFVMYGA